MPHAIDITNLMSSKIYCHYLNRCLNNFYGSDIAESSRATSLSMLDNTIYNNSIFNTKHVKFPKKWISAPLFFTTLLVYKITQTITTNYPLLYFNQFSPPFFFTKPSLQSPPKLPSARYQPFFILLFLYTVMLTIPSKTSSPLHFLESRESNNIMQKRLT